MQMAELSRRSNVPVATVKYYLRERLLHPGVATSATRAEYDESHVARLRLIRALAEVAGLRLDQIRAVLAVVDDPDTPMHEALGTALAATSGAPGRPGTDARRRVDRLLRRWRWRVHRESSSRDRLAMALEALDELGQPLSDERLQGYADALGALAEAEVGGVPADDRLSAVRYAVVGTLLVEPVLAALRRLAHEDASARRFGTRRAPRAAAAASVRTAPRSRG